MELLTRDLTLNLVSEGIAILVTIFGIDRLMQWRERRRWRRVRAAFHEAAGYECLAGAVAWRDWLVEAAVMKAKVLVLPAGQPAPRLKRADPAGHLRWLEHALGSPTGARFLTSCGSATKADIHRLERSLGDHLAARLRAPDCPAAATLHDRLLTSATALADLVDRFAPIVHPDPEFAFPVIRFRLLLDELGRYDLKRRGERDETRLSMQAHVMAELLGTLLLLTAHVVRNGL